jgi:hypothetical protein
MIRPIVRPSTLPSTYADAAYVPSPEGAVDWVRWTIFTIPEEKAAELGAGWASRVDTVGGGQPKNCANANANKQVEVPFSCYYYFYPCPDDEISGEATLTSSATVALQNLSALAILAAAAVLAF